MVSLNAFREIGRHCLKSLPVHDGLNESHLIRTWDKITCVIASVAEVAEQLRSDWLTVEEGRSLKKPNARFSLIR